MYAELYTLCGSFGHESIDCGQQWILLFSRQCWASHQPTLNGCSAQAEIHGTSSSSVQPRSCTLRSFSVLLFTRLKARPKSNYCSSNVLGLITLTSTPTCLIVCIALDGFNVRSKENTVEVLKRIFLTFICSDSTWLCDMYYTFHLHKGKIINILSYIIMYTITS